MKPPPEEKLLKLIRGRAAQPSGEAVPAAAGADPGVVGSLSAIERPARRLRWLSVAIWGLGTVLAAEAAALVYVARQPAPDLHLPAVQRPARAEPDEAAPTPEPLELPSLAASASRPLFFSPVPEPPPTPPQQPSAPNPVAGQLATRLTLMGVVAGDPAQAIIHDQQTQKTFFVSPGQPVIEGAILKAVQGHSAILELAGEQIELTL
jgi:hypothetical protein